MPELPSLAVLPALPEIIVTAGAMALLMFGAFSGERSTRMISWLAVAVLILALIVSQLGGGERRLAFYGMFVTEAFALLCRPR
jgi:NADH-quinone oxidoreductase subunit N